MIRQTIIAFFLILSIEVQAQLETPFYGYNGYPPNSIIKQDSTGSYFYADTNRIVFISKYNIVYRVYDSSYKLLVDGDLGGRIYVDYYKRFGKWTEYYDNGKVKRTGFYHSNQPIGLWQTFFSNGGLQKRYSITYVQTDSSSNFCLTGSYQEFYDNGNLKVNGFYKAKVDTISTEQINVHTGKIDTVVVRQPVSKKYGIWTYYKLNGEVEKKEDFQ